MLYILAGVERAPTSLLPRKGNRIMPTKIFKVAEARASFSSLLARAKEGEEIMITKGSEPQARIVPPAEAAQREAAPLKHLNLPDDLFDREDQEQAAIDAGDFGDALGIWRGPPKAS